MKKNQPEEQIIEEHDGNGKVDFSAMMSILQEIKADQRDLNQRMDDIEENKSSTIASAQRDLVHMIYNTEEERLPELTSIPNAAAARIHAMGMALEDMDNPKYAGIPLSRIVRMHYFRLMRSVKGLQLGRGSRLAEEQAVAKGEQDGENGIEFGGE